METIGIENPFGAPVYRFAVVGSTMDAARSLAAEGAPHGTVAVADVQEAGRGRVPGRVWDDERGKSLLCTTLLRFPDLAAMPTGLTLRVGLAAARALEDAAPPLRDRVFVKWPNDVMILSPGRPVARKACGILCESDGRTVYVGVGINVGQARFSESLAAKATSIAIETAEPERAGDSGGLNRPESPDRFAVLALLLARLKEALSSESDAAWKRDLEDRLYLRGGRVRFVPGAADSGDLVEGLLSGIDDSGALRILTDGETVPRAFVAGELLAYT